MPLPARKRANPPSRRICTSSSVPTPTRSLCAAVVRLSVPRRGGYRTFAVSTTEKDGVHEQWVQLVNTDAVTPPRCERGRLVVGGDDAVEERRAEQREHRQVGLPMPTMRRRVDEPTTSVGAPEEVATPQVAVNARRWFVGVGQLL